MGGKSSIAVSFDDGMRATGYLNTDGGGFAGCWRNVAEPVDVSSYAGVAVTYAALDASAPPLALELRLGGEGDTGGGWIDHRAVFALSPSADADGVGVATLPFDAFVPRWRGSERTGSLDLAAINQMGLQLLFQEGAYDFTILEIAVVDDLARDDPAPALGASPSPAEVVNAIDATIEVGVYVYNKGYPSQCDKIYAATARSVAASLEGGAGLREDARAALADAAAAAEAMGYSENDEIHRAWALRHGLDDARAAAVAAGDGWEADATHATDAMDAMVATDETDATDATHATDVADVSDAADTADAADAADATDSTDSAAPEPATDSSSSPSSDDNDMVMLLALAGAVARARAPPRGARARGPRGSSASPRGRRRAPAIPRPTGKERFFCNVQKQRTRSRAKPAQQSSRSPKQQSRTSRATARAPSSPRSCESRRAGASSCRSTDARRDGSRTMGCRPAVRGVPDSESSEARRAAGSRAIGRRRRRRRQLRRRRRGVRLRRRRVDGDLLLSPGPPRFFPPPVA